MGTYLISHILLLIYPFYPNSLDDEWAMLPNFYSHLAAGVGNIT